jgi:polyphosphate kinase 2 (PPK2 family)
MGELVADSQQDEVGPEKLEEEVDEVPGAGGKDSSRAEKKKTVYNKKGKLKRKIYEKELARRQEELVKLQYWIRDQKLKVVVVFEGRDAAGKGGVIKRIMLRLNPRIVRVVALPTATEKETTEWYFQRDVAHLPAGGQMVLFDRSWYNRAVVERVMEFCTD